MIYLLMVDIAPPDPAKYPKWKITLQIAIGVLLVLVLIVASIIAYQTQLAREGLKKEWSEVQTIEERLEENAQALQTLIQEQNTFRQNYEVLIQEIEVMEKSLVDRIKTVEKETALIDQNNRQIFGDVQDLKRSVRTLPGETKTSATPTAWEAMIASE